MRNRTVVEVAGVKHGSDGAVVLVTRSSLPCYGFDTGVREGRN